VAVRPPARPSRIGQQVAATDSIAQLPEGQASAPPGTPRTYSVQLAVRPTEEAARTAYDQLADKFATDLGGKPATVTQAQVNGRSVFRVRVTPLSREDANTLCTRLKASGGQCFVAAN
jgi:cell division septation protein DedD